MRATKVELHATVWILSFGYLGNGEDSGEDAGDGKYLRNACGQRTSDSSPVIK
jgi:hypothetical protein